MERRLEIVYSRLRAHLADGSERLIGEFPPRHSQFGLQATLYHGGLRFMELNLSDEIFSVPNDWSLCRRMMRAGVRMGMVDKPTVDFYPSEEWGRRERLATDGAGPELPTPRAPRRRRRSSRGSAPGPTDLERQLGGGHVIEELAPHQPAARGRQARTRPGLRLGAGVKRHELLSFPVVPDHRGNLTFVEGNAHIPFEIKRVFYLYDVPGGESRAGHALKDVEQVIIAMSGSFDVVLDDGSERETITLNRSYYGAVRAQPGVARAGELLLGLGLPRPRVRALRRRRLPPRLRGVPARRSSGTAMIDVPVADPRAGLLAARDELRDSFERVLESGSYILGGRSRRSSANGRRAARQATRSGSTAAPTRWRSRCGRSGSGAATRCSCRP